MPETVKIAPGYQPERSLRKAAWDVAQSAAGLAAAAVLSWIALDPPQLQALVAALPPSWAFVAGFLVSAAVAYARDYRKHRD